VPVHQIDDLHGDRRLHRAIKRLPVRSEYPPDKQLAAIKEVMDQMKAMAARDAEVAAVGTGTP
jgi:hypothetical protein